MTFAAEWSRKAAVEFETPDELDRIIDAIQPEPPTGLPVDVSIYVVNDQKFPPTVQIGVGHPSRSYVCFIDVNADDELSGWAREPGVDEWPDAIRFDVGGEPSDAVPDRTRVTPVRARQAAREFVATGQRPTNVDWFQD